MYNILLFYISIFVIPFSPLPKDNVKRDKLPMRDELLFPTATKIPRIPKGHMPVPHA